MGDLLAAIDTDAAAATSRIRCHALPPWDPVATDSLDQALIVALQRSPRASYATLARLTEIDAELVSQRVRRLLLHKAILGIRALVNPPPERANAISLVSMLVLDSKGQHARHRFVEAVHDIAEIVSCHEVAGDFDFLLRSVVPDMQHYRRLIAMLPQVRALRTVTVVETVKALPHPTRLRIPIDARSCKLHAEVNGGKRP